MGRIVSRALGAFADWALSKNAPGGYEGEGDTRWAYTIETGGSPYLTRILFSNLLPIKKWLGIGVYLHHFHRPDIDRYLHSHPWRWAASLILTGSYSEERLEGVIPAVGDIAATQIVTEARVARWFNFIRDTDYHKVLELHGDVWTLFITGPRTVGDGWGFLVDGVHVPHKQFLGKG